MSGALLSSGSLFSFVVIVLTAGSAVAAGLWLDAWLFHRNPPERVSVFDEAVNGAVFLFDGTVLVDCTPAGRAILAVGELPSGPWSRLMAFLAPMFGELEEKLSTLAERGHLSLASDGVRQILLTAEMRGGLTRISLVDAGREDDMPAQDPMTWRAMAEELEQLRGIVSEAPMLMWRERSDGAVTWANAAYVLALAERLEPRGDFAWPLERLFETAPAPGEAPERQMLTVSEGRTHWYELQSRTQGAETLVFALPADGLNQTEGSLRDVMVTLTKTFAHLDAGLAIFDHRLQLQLFNPAMVDLTGLPADFLARRPSLTAVLDKMHERNAIPEPRDYRSWRNELLHMEKAATSGLFQETWNLPSGQTYRVVGRPQPDGALALIFEDISDEVTRSRRYRAEIELGHAAIDGLDEAVAIFSQSGELVKSNAAYARLWGHDPATAAGAATLDGLLGRWKEQAAPTQVWEELKTMISMPLDRHAIHSELRLKDGRLLASHFTPLVGGATMAAFSVVTTASEAGAVRAVERIRA